MDKVVRGIFTSELWLAVLALLSPLVQDFIAGKIDLVSVLISGAVAVAYLASRTYLKAKGLTSPNE